MEILLIFSAACFYPPWSDSLPKLRELIVEGVEFCLESKDFIIEEHFDSSVSA